MSFVKLWLAKHRVARAERLRKAMVCNAQASNILAALPTVPEVSTWQACGRGICAREDGHPGKCNY